MTVYGNQVTIGTGATSCNTNQAVALPITVIDWCEVDNINGYFSGAGSSWIKFVIWNASGAVVANSISPAYNNSGTSISWKTYNYSGTKPILQPGTYYIGLVVHDVYPYAYVRYQANTSSNTRQVGNSYATPTTYAPTQDANRNHSFYINVTEIENPTELSKVYTKEINTEATKIFGVDFTDLSKFYSLLIPEAPSGERGVMIGGYTTAQVSTSEYITISTLGNTTYFGDLTGGLSMARAGMSNSSNQRGVAGESEAGYEMAYITISTLGDTVDFGDLAVWRGGWGAGSNATNERGILFSGLISYPTPLDNIDYITINSTGNSTDFGNMTRPLWGVTCTSNGENERLLGGGGQYNGTSPVNNVQYVTVNSIGNATDFGDLRTVKVSIPACSNMTNERALWFGRWAAVTNDIDYFTINSASNWTDFGDLTAITALSSATDSAENERGINFGGYTGSVNYQHIDYVTISTTGNAADFGDLSAAMRNGSGVSNA
jgi:hypothetical protein